jgi:hypothetical protein
VTAVELRRPSPGRAATSAAARAPAAPGILIAPALAAAAALVGAAAGWRGTDLPAQLYRVTMFKQVGLTAWDPQWFGGHWAPSYSVLYPPVAAVLGVTLTAVLCAAGAALAFERLVVPRFGAAGRAGAVVFAVGTTQQLAIGQLAFLMGEAFALGACWAAARRRWPLAAVLGVGAALASPLAGGFLALAGTALVVAATPADRARHAVVVAGALAPLAALAVMFSDPGPFPFPAVDFAFDLAVAIVLWLLVPKGDRLLRTGAALYVAATVACFVVPNPVGGNVGRLAEVVALPLGTCVLWAHRRLVLGALAVPMALAVWGPAWASLTGRANAQPSAHRGYYAPMVAFVTAHDEPMGRVEVVPTQYHWETVYVAPSVPLARGWERQLDVARNPIFYGARLDAGNYRAWLAALGVRYVALPDAPLDMAGTAEARLVRAGVPGLRQVWADAHWRVFAVDGSPGIVSGPARLVSERGDRVVLDVTGPGAVLVRVAGGSHWGCVTPVADGVVVQVQRPGRLELGVGVRAHGCRRAGAGPPP